MANYDVIITNAKLYHNNIIDNHKRRALMIYAMAIEFMATTDYTTAAGQKTLVANATKAMAGLPPAEFPRAVGPVEVAIWFKAAESGNAGLATASIHSKLAAIPYLLNCDDDVLAKTSVFMLGVALSPLS